MAVFDLYQEGVRPPEIDESFVVVLAGDRSLREIGDWPLPREKHARVLERLAGARLVVLDILFPEPSAPADDAMLAATADRFGNVIAAASILPGRTGGAGEIVLPYKALAESALDIGMANVEPEADGISRDYRLLWPAGDSAAPSLPVVIFQRAGGELSFKKTPAGENVLSLPAGEVGLDDDFRFKVHSPKENPPVYEYVDVLNGLVDPAAFRGAVVVVGVDAAGASDALAVGGGRMLPGSVFVANAARTLFHGWIPRGAGKPSRVLAAAILALAGALIALLNAGGGRGRILSHGLLWLLALSLVWLGLDYWLFLKLKIFAPPVMPWLLGLASFGLVMAVKTRLLAAEWRVLKMSVDSVLTLGGHDVADMEMTFSEYLLERWPEIEKWSGVSLLHASVATDSQEMRHMLSRLPAAGVPSGKAMEVSVIYARRGLSRLILGLPDPESKISRYTVLGWTGAISPETIRSLSALVLSVANHFKAVEEYKARQRLFIGVIKIIMEAVDAKDPYTSGHSNRVADLAKELASKLELPAKDVDDIYLGGLLHDVGKLGIPDHILNKPGALDENEMNVMRTHPSIGTAFMTKIELPEAVLHSITEHHERPDGRGYPNKLLENELSLAGKILKIADVFDALVSKRQYKDPMPVEKAYDILVKGRGVEFDGKLIDLIMEKPFDIGRQGGDK
jgi:putative nucleotidyltransferase with HDIG domain